jgi:rare lipoprotein A (peptidoglycan hydrolase)
VFNAAHGCFLVLGNDRSEADVGLASWYSPEFEGRQTASGETYDPNGYTAAHNSLPLGTGLVVSYGERSVPVRVNDRGPFLGTRELDLSQAAARDLGLTREGVGYVEYEVVGSPGVDPSRQAAQTLVPSLPAAQQPGFPQGVAEQPYPSQGTAQQPALTQGAAQQPEPLQGTAQQPNLSQRATQQPTLSQGVSQQPNPVQEAGQQSSSLKVTQQPGLSRPRIRGLLRDRAY